MFVTSEDQPVDPEAESTEQFTILSKTPGELYLVERLIFQNVLCDAILSEFAKKKSDYPCDKELRKMCLAQRDWTKFKFERVAEPQ